MPPRQSGAAILDAPTRSRTLPQRLLARPRRKDDAEALWRLFDQGGLQGFDTSSAPFDSPEDVQAWIDGNGAGNFEIVGSIDGAAVAFAGLYPLRGGQNHVGTVSLCVHAAFQGRGIGTALLRLILASADVLAGLRRVQLSVLADNARAIALYEAFGFRIEGRHASFARRGDDYADAFTMARLTPEPPAAKSNADIIALVGRLLPQPRSASLAAQP